MMIRRGAIDIGSGATKIVIADVWRFNDHDVCVNSIDTIHFGLEYPVGFSADYQSSTCKTLSDTIQSKGLNVINTIMNKCIEYNVTEYSSIATEVFRKASNGDEYLNKIRQLGIPVKIISQSEEAMLGYTTGIELNRYNNKHKSTETSSSLSMPVQIIWDSGGGSFQITTLINNVLTSYMGDIGALGSYKLLIENIRKLRITASTSSTSSRVNPVSSEEVNSLISILLSKLSEVPPWLINQHIIAIGGYNSIFQLALQLINHINKTNIQSFTSEDIQSILNYIANKSDKDFMFLVKDDFSDPPYLLVPKISLLYAVMIKANMETVTPVLCVGSCAGLLTTEAYW